MLLAEPIAYGTTLLRNLKEDEEKPKGIKGGQSGIMKHRCMAGKMMTRRSLGGLSLGVYSWCEVGRRCDIR